MTDSFGEPAAEMVNETEVEASIDAASASAAPADEPDEVLDAEVLDAEVLDAEADLADAGAEAGADAGAGVGAGVGAGEVDELGAAKAALDERTLDLQRLQAEFLNYKRRVERDRELIEENARFKVLSPIIDVLDTIDRAREHGELDGGFKAVAEQLERTVANLGLVRFGAEGDAFDPNLHEALSHVGTDPEVSVTTARHIAKAGYKIGERVVRPAQVLVVDPAS